MARDGKNETIQVPLQNLRATLNQKPLHQINEVTPIWRPKGRQAAKVAQEGNIPMLG